MIQDFKYALRSLSRNPLFAFGAIATLALGIGVNSTIFTLANSALFGPMPAYRRAIRARVGIRPLARPRPIRRDVVPGIPRLSGSIIRSLLERFCLRAHGLQSWQRWRPAADSRPPRQRLLLHRSRRHPRPPVGCCSTSDDQASSIPAAVISFRLWRHRFAAQMPQRPILINGRQVSVVGVAPEGFVGPELAQSADLWMPIAALPVINSTQAAWLQERGTLWLRVMGRLRPATAIQQRAGGADWRRHGARTDLPGDKQEPGGAGLECLVRCPAL